MTNAMPVKNSASSAIEEPTAAMSSKFVPPAAP